MGIFTRKEKKRYNYSPPPPPIPVESGPPKAHYQNTQNYPNQLITFMVGTGDSRIKFKVHRQPACQQSRKINNDCGDDEKWATFNSGYTYTVDYVDTKTFRLFHEYIYSRKITLPFHNVYHRDDTEPTDSPDHQNPCSQQDVRLVKLWNLAERFQISDLQNHVVDNLMRGMESCGSLNHECFDFVYKNTKPGSALRQLFIDMCCWVPAEDTYYETRLERFPNEMLADIAKNFHKATSDNRRFKDETLHKIALDNCRPKDETLEKIASDNSQSKDEPTISIHAWYKQEMVASNYYV